MRKFPTVEVHTIPEFVAEVLELANDWAEKAPEDSDVWFRGSNDEQLSLLPGA